MEKVPALELDHLIIGAAKIGEGIDFVEETLGVRMPLGGKHVGMNTHNAVMRLTEGLYLEVIAIDHEAGPALRPRWFELDDPRQQARLASEGPRLIAWAARSSDLAASLRASVINLGEPMAMSRGTLSWKIAVPCDGALVWGGLLPTLIEWPPGVHPTTQRMPDLGVRFAGLTLRAAKPEPVRAALAGVGAERLAEIKTLRRGAVPMEAIFVRQDGREVAIGGG